PLSSYLVINDTAATALYTLSLHDALPIWRGIAQGTQHLDVAALNAVVPGIEGRTNGHQSEPDDGGPLSPTRWPDGFLQRQMAQRRQHRRAGAEPCDDAGRHRWETPRQQRIARPDEGAGERCAVTERTPGVEGNRAAIADDKDHPREAEQRADHVMPAEPLAWHQRRAEHDEQRPQIGDQAGFDRRCVAERREV